MSTRTIVEFNHDYLRRLEREPELLQDLLGAMCSSSLTGALNVRGQVRMAGGITVLAQRHHSETLKLEVK